MSNIVMGSRAKPKSPYKALLSTNSRSKLSADTTRKIYLHELPLKRSGGARSIEEERQYHSSSRNLKDFHLHLDRQQHRSQTKEPFSDRKNQKDLPREGHSGRHSKFAKNKLYSSSSKMDRQGEKSTMISTLLSSHQQRQQKLKEDLKRHEEGKNCRVIVIDGN